MLFSLIGFETQTCTIICEPICNIISAATLCMWVYLLNPSILVMMLIYQGHSWHSADYRVYISESMRASMC